MSYSRTRIAATGLLLLCSLQALARNVKVVANPSIKADSISKSELKGIFMAERNSLNDGSHVQPVFERTGSAHEIFVREYLKESSESLQNYYGALVFTGKGSMPTSFNSDAEVLAFVARTRGAIGYVDASASTEGVKVLAVLPEESRSNRVLLTRVQPEYPETLRQLKIGGTVRLQITISPQGKVTELILLGGNPILGEAAIRAVKQWIYVPGPSRSTLQVLVPFDAH